tara:strand:+ start:989 stop:1147 length:159 start_codon:yes stop_codon:yes gene_type:complete
MSKQKETQKFKKKDNKIVIENVTEIELTDLEIEHLKKKRDKLIQMCKDIDKL